MNKKKIISIGITGKIGSGKTTVTKYFESTGYPVLFMDIVGHEVLKSNEIAMKLTEKFGDSILDEGKMINRKKLGEIVFSKQDNLKFLNGMMHPLMNEEAKRWISENEKKAERVCFIEAAILFEMKMDQFLDKILFIDLAENEIIERTKKRGKKTEAEIKTILSTQYVKEDKIDYVIDNSGSVEELYKKCREFEGIISDYLDSGKNMI